MRGKIVKRKGKKKPSILIIDNKVRPRSPLLTQFYNHMSNTFDIKIDERYDIPAEQIINERYKKGCKPDYIEWGFMRGSSINRSCHYINKNKIKIIVDMGDIQYFVTGHRRNLERVKVSFIMARWPATPDYSHLVLLKSFKKKFRWLKDAKVINVPWGVEPKLYPEPDYNARDIDASFICTVSDRRFHDTRKHIKDELGKIEGLNIKVGSWFGNEYTQLLRRSKISIVEGSKRDFLVQKYLEGPVNGCAIMGEIPSPAKAVLKDGQTIIETDYSDLEEKIRYYIKEDAERIKIAKAGRNAILSNYSLNKSTALFKKRILEDCNG